MLEHFPQECSTHPSCEMDKVVSRFALFLQVLHFGTELLL